MRYDRKSGFQWGYEIDRITEEKIVAIKLLLDPSQKQPFSNAAGETAVKLVLEKLANQKPGNQKLRKAPLDIASDYIAAIFEHAMKTIEGKVPKEYLAMLSKQFVMSVPAVWSDKAKDSTLRVCNTNILLIDESTNS